MTVYQKGSEIIRMYHTLLGEEGFQAGMRLYFERHDGQAVTCDDFLAAMADANGIGLDKFSRWYGQSGTPVLRVVDEYDANLRRYTLRMSQFTPKTHDQAEKQALLIPVLAGLLTADGKELEVEVNGERSVSASTVLLLLDEQEKEFVFENVPERPVPSLLRDFSAPVRLEYDYTEDSLAVLMAHDSNPFTRWEAAQLLAQRAILSNVARRSKGRSMQLAPALEKAFQKLLDDRSADPALVAEAITLPGEEYLAELVETVDVDGIHAARNYVKAQLATRLQSRLEARYRALASDGPYDKSQTAMAHRSLRNTCLSYLQETSVGQGLAESQLESSDNMTDTLAALRGLVWKKAPAARRALASFESRWSGDALVMDKWFTIQASAPGADTLGTVESLMDHPAFSIQNPNKVRSLIGVFTTMNPTGFHAADGSGYRFLADRVIELDRINPQIAARTAGAFNQWTRYDDERRQLMKKELQRISEVDSLSGDVSEIVRNALAMK